MGLCTCMYYYICVQECAHVPSWYISSHCKKCVRRFPRTKITGGSSRKTKILLRIRLETDIFSLRTLFLSPATMSGTVLSQRFLNNPWNREHFSESVAWETGNLLEEGILSAMLRAMLQLIKLSQAFCWYACSSAEKFGRTESSLFLDPLTRRKSSVRFHGTVVYPPGGAAGYFPATSWWFQVKRDQASRRRSYRLCSRCANDYRCCKDCHQ